MDSTHVPILLFCLLMAAGNHAHAQNLPEDYVKEHNVARKEVGVPDIEWDEKLAKVAQAYAEKRAQDCEMVHSGGEYGENLAAGSWDLTAKEAVDMWLEEKHLYDVNTNKCLKEEASCLHYTQVVWRSSFKVGCGKGKCKDGWTIVCCNYDPPGNYIGERPY